MKKLGFGTMRMPQTDETNAKSVDLERLNPMVDAFFKEGFTYVDTAFMYHGFRSENFVKEAVVDRYPRESFVLADKLPLAMLKTEEDVESIYEKQKVKTGVSYFDYYLYHNMNSHGYEIANKLDVFSFLQKKKAEGEIKHLGFSFHDNAEVLDKILTEHPEMEFVQLQLNYLDWDSEGVQSRKCYETACKHNVPVIVMEPVKGGILAKLDQDIEAKMKAMHPDWSIAGWAIRFVASLDNVMMVLSGMSNMEQMENNMSFMKDFEPLGEAEVALLKEAAEKIQSSIAIACTGCRYCIEESTCPQNIPIPNFFSLYNTQQLQKSADWTTEGELYDNLVAQGFGRASDCVGCKSCEVVCPQHLEISDLLNKVSETWDEGEE